MSSICTEKGAVEIILTVDEQGRRDQKQELAKQWKCTEDCLQERNVVIS